MRPSTFFAGAALAAALALPGPPAARADDKPAPTAAPGLDALMARFRAIPGLSARFREEKRIALLAKPLVSEGTIHYAPAGPDGGSASKPPGARLARHQLTPTISTVLLEGDTLRFGDGTTEERVDLGVSPVVRAFVDGFLQLLAGDRASLEKAFAIEHRPGGGEKWEIVLRPKLPAIARVIKEMAFTGEGVVVARMRLLEATGDEAITTFSEVDPRHRYTPAEAQQIFRLPKK